MVMLRKRDTNHDLWIIVKPDVTIGDVVRHPAERAIGVGLDVVVGPNKGSLRFIAGPIVVDRTIIAFALDAFRPVRVPNLRIRHADDAELVVFGKQATARGAAHKG